MFISNMFSNGIFFLENDFEYENKTISEIYL
jgi:hypothetical protein